MPFRTEVGSVLGLCGAEVVVELELPLRRLEPRAGFAFEDDSETALGVRVELLQWVQALCESTEQRLLDATHFLHRFAEVTRSLSCCCCVVAGLDRKSTRLNSSH